ncbi:MAG TPA: hypothetical protein VFL55_11910 [Acetobacteraceae bacterium]|nr:hypothetical protein [Acetobacteraceae bacterium]
MLLIVLWWLALLALIVTQLVASGRTEARIAANLRDGAIAEAVADAAVHRAIFQVLAHRWDIDGRLREVGSEQGTALVRIDDEGSKIDPNVAPPPLMAALLRACGAPTKTADALAAAIYQWRGIDVTGTVAGKIAQQYSAASLGYLPPNKRFVSEDEVGLVLGMTPDLLACIRPHISVYSLSLPSLSTSNDRLVRQALVDAYADAAVVPVGQRMQEVSVVRILATAQTVAGTRFRRLAIVRVINATLDERFAYRILYWEGGAG